MNQDESKMNQDESKMTYEQQKEGKKKENIILLFSL